MPETSILLLTASEVQSLLKNEELLLIDLVREAYIAHDKGMSSLPHSTFLRFFDMPANRIIGLPAYLKSTTSSAGIKWVASFPENIKTGKNRASAVVILNRVTDGRAKCILEASHINAARTAASAVLGAKLMTSTEPKKLVLIGCGPINLAVAQYATKAFPSLTHIDLYDTEQSRATELHKKITPLKISNQVLGELQPIQDGSTLISIATNASEPWLDDPSFFGNSMILHISLRDLSPNFIENSINVVDDIAHVNREKTSIHLTSERLGSTSFISTSIGKFAQKPTPFKTSGKPIVFSPFGLGILDLTVSEFLYHKACSSNVGTIIPNFHATEEL